MLLNRVEYALMNNPLRAAIQRRFEARRLLRMGGPVPGGAALELGCPDVKFFPAEASGGMPYLKSMAGPYAHLGVRFIPLGGLKADNCETYLQAPNVLAVGGSWLAPRADVQGENWATITERAAGARSIVERVRGA